MPLFKKAPRSCQDSEFPPNLAIMPARNLSRRIEAFNDDAFENAKEKINKEVILLNQELDKGATPEEKYKLISKTLLKLESSFN